MPIFIDNAFMLVWLAFPVLACNIPLIYWVAMPSDVVIWSISGALLHKYNSCLHTDSRRSTCEAKLSDHLLPGRDE